MIISASRRTDIPAFYAQWLINRVKAGYLTVPNPFNRKQISTVSLKPEDVDVIVFWTRNPRPLMPYLKILDELELRYYFQYTLLGYPKHIDPKSPSLENALSTFRDLADMIGAKKVIWRYDPILFSNVTHPEYHLEQYQKIANALAGYTHRSVISIVDEYAKNRSQFQKLAEVGITIQHPQSAETWLTNFIRDIVSIAGEHNMEIFSCAEEINLTPLGVKRGKCIDDDLIHELFGINVTSEKDPNQRLPCGCVVSKDIGMYNTCLYGCAYCYAIRSIESAKNNYKKHDPLSPSLLGWYETKLPGGEEKDVPTQPSLF
jgi:hypothetical protein